MNKSIFALLGGTVYLSFTVVPYMIKAGIEAVGKKVIGLPKYRVYLDSGSNLRKWHDNEAVKDPNLAGRLLPFLYKVDPQTGTRTFDNREHCNREFIFGHQSKAKATGIITLGPLAGHFDFINREGNRIQRASTGESLMFWNLADIHKAKVPVIQVFDRGGKDNLEVYKVTDNRLYFSAGREVTLREPKRFEEHGTRNTGL